MDHTGTLGNCPTCNKPYKGKRRRCWDCKPSTPLHKRPKLAVVDEDDELDDAVELLAPRRSTIGEAMQAVTEIKRILDPFSMDDTAEILDFIKANP